MSQKKEEAAEYDPNRGQEVIKYVREFFDKHIPIDGTSWKNIAGLKIVDKNLIISKMTMNINYLIKKNLLVIEVM